MTEYWQPIPDKSSELFLEIKDPDGWYMARVKWDGCVEYYRYFNTPYPQTQEDEMVDSMHLCDIDEEIARLQALKRMAYNYFEEHGRADHSWSTDVVEGNVVRQEPTRYVRQFSGLYLLTEKESN